MRRPNVRTVNPTFENDKGMDPIKLRFRPNRPGFRIPNIKYTHPRSRFVFYSSIFVALVLSCYILFFGRKNRETEMYGVVIDGGSTGTRIHVFKYVARKGAMVLDFSEKGLVSMKVNPGLSAYVEEPEGAGAAVAELVEFAKRHVPKEQWKEADIRLMATAGMRLLKTEDQERILNVCRRVLRKSGFQFKDDGASVISGSDEGLYAWVVANYALGTLGSHPAQTTGIIELGGASVQLTFATDELTPLEFSRKVNFGNFTYNLYSHSFLQFGQNVAFELLKESLVAGGQGMAAEEFLQAGKPTDPCTPRGYTHDDEAWKLSPTSVIEKSRYLSTLLPNGNFSGCRSASLELLQKGQGSKFIPKLQGKFLATENFFHTSKFFGLRERAFLSDLMVSGQEYCGQNWSKLKQKYPTLEEEELLRYCFSSAYIIALLHDNLGISLHDMRIAYANQVENVPLDWALGAFILLNSSKLDMQHSNWTASMLGDSSALTLLFGIFLVLILVTWIISKLRKPQVKTIYDLEKGKYIITRVGRYS